MPIAGEVATLSRMWNQPYLETCCRSALHRLYLCEAIGRPATEKDSTCLSRLETMGLARLREDGRFGITAAGRFRHAQAVMAEHAPC